MQHLGDRLVFGALRASLGASSSFLQRGALMLFTANGAHHSLRRYLLAVGDAGMAGECTVKCTAQGTVQRCRVLSVQCSA